MSDKMTWTAMLVDSVILIFLFSSLAGSFGKFAFDRRLEDCWKWAIPLFILSVLLAFSAVALLGVSAVELVAIGL